MDGVEAFLFFVVLYNLVFLILWYSLGEKYLNNNEQKEVK